MIRLPRLFLGLLTIFMIAGATHAQAANSCASVKPFQTAITVNLSTPDPVFNNDFSKSQIVSKGIPDMAVWTKKNSLQPLWTVNDLSTGGGMAWGDWGAVYDMNTEYDPFDHYGAYYCAFFRSITIELMYRPVVDIPSSLPKDSCAYNIIKDHEMAHLDANAKAVQLYVEQLRYDLPNIVAQIEANYGSKADIKKRTADIRQNLQDAVTLYFNQSMSAKISQLTGLIDTPQELTLRNNALDACNK